MFLINYIMCSSKLRGSWDGAQWWRGWLSLYPGPRMQKRQKLAAENIETDVYTHMDVKIYVYNC